MPKKIILLLLLLLILWGVPLFVTTSAQESDSGSIGTSKAPIPGNDDLTNATMVPALPYNDEISYIAPESATGEPDEAICGNQQAGIGFTASAWYKYTAGQSGVLNVTITPMMTATTDVSLAIYTGPTDNPTHPLTDEVGCRNVAGAGQAENLAAGVSAGTTYYVRVATLSDSGHYRVDMIDSVSIFLPAVFKSPPRGSWQAQDSTIEVDLHAIDCPTTTFCVAVGVNGVIVTTTDGGTTWDSKSSGTVIPLNDVSCRDANNCVAVGDGGLILRTSDGGNSWADENSGTDQDLRGVSCATDNCAAVGGEGTSTAIVSENGGDSWSVSSLGNTDLFGVDCPNDGTCTLVGDGGRVLVTADMNIKDKFDSLTPNRLETVDCATDQICVIAGHNGTVYTTSNGGSSWTSRTSDTVADLRDVSCPTTETCYAAGDDGLIITTADTGVSWADEETGATINLNGVSCPSPSVCYAVGDEGTILGKK